MIRRIIATILIVAMLLCCGCTQQAAEDTVSFGEDWLLNTYCYIKILEPEKDETIKDCFKLARSLEGELSKTIESSAVSKINKAPAKTGFNCDDPEFVNAGVVLGNAIDFEVLSGGDFTASIGPVSNLWDFTSGEGKAPAEEEIQNALKVVGTKMIWVNDDGSIEKAADEVQIDFGAIAKGYIASQCANFLRDSGVQRAILSFGGNIVLLGQKEDKSAWAVGIEAPTREHGDEVLEERQSVGSITWDGASGDLDAIANGVAPAMSIVTSGTYERFIEDGEKIYHHILDPKTGRSAETDLVSATIVGPDSMQCDALATIAILKGSSAAQEFLEEYKSVSLGQYEYVLITEAGEIIKSENCSFTE